MLGDMVLVRKMFLAALASPFDVYGTDTTLKVYLSWSVI